jgi:hypothetical protein
MCVYANPARRGRLSPRVRSRALGPRVAVGRSRRDWIHQRDSCSLFARQAPRKSRPIQRDGLSSGAQRGFEYLGCCCRFDDLGFAAVRDFHFAGLGLFGDGDRDGKYATVVAGCDPIRVEAVA